MLRQQRLMEAVVIALATALAATANAQGPRGGGPGGGGPQFGSGPRGGMNMSGQGFQADRGVGPGGQGGMIVGQGGPLGQGQVGTGGQVCLPGGQPVTGTTTGTTTGTALGGFANPYGQLPLGAQQNPANQLRNAQSTAVTTATSSTESKPARPSRQTVLAQFDRDGNGKLEGDELAAAKAAAVARRKQKAN